MRGFMNSLPLQALLVLWVICSANGAPYSKYGRTCKDIGCLPRETCVMAYESCSFSQQENVSCGRYPTCKKITDGQATQQNSGSSSPSLPTSKPLPSIWNVPTTPSTTTTTTTRRTTTSTTRRSFTTPSPFYNPSNPSYNGGGGYYGSRYDGGSTFGGSSFTRPTTKRPSSSSSSGGLSGFLSGLSDVFGGDVGKFIGSAINSRGGSSSSGGLGGFGSFGSFGGGAQDSRQSYRGSLFSENTPKPSTGTNVGPYPVTRYGDASPPSSNSNANPSHGNYGWKLQ